MKKRLVSMILSAVLFATSVPVTAFAEDANAQNPVAQSEEGTSQGTDVLKECKYVIIRICQQLYFSDTLFS